MKVVVRLAVLLAALLLVSNMAFAAAVCDGDTLQVAAQKNKYLCYNVTVTPDGGLPMNGTAQVCLEDDGIGHICSSFDACDNLYLFGGGATWFNFPGDPMFGGKPQWTKWMTVLAGGVGEIQPIGTTKNILTGTGFIPPSTRYTISGMRTFPCPAP